MDAHSTVLNLFEPAQAACAGDFREFYASTTRGDFPVSNSRPGGQFRALLLTRGTVRRLS